MELVGTHRVEIDFIFRPSEPLPRPDFETSTTTDFADIALYENQKVFFVVVFATESSPTYMQLKLSSFYFSSVKGGYYSSVNGRKVTAG